MSDDKYDKADDKKRRQVRVIAITVFFVVCGIVTISITKRIFNDPTNQRTVDKTMFRQAVMNELSQSKEEEHQQLMTTNKGGGESSKSIMKIKNGSSSSSSNEEERKEKEKKLSDIVKKLDLKVRSIKSSLPRKEFMETNPTALEATKKLQDATIDLLRIRYGRYNIGRPYRVRVTLEFQNTMPDFDEKGPMGSFLIEMAPAELLPHSVFTFLEIARSWNGGAFHRNAAHVLQVMVRSNEVTHLAFQEYSEKYPHKKGTLGYAGRPSGPEWYVSILNNSRAHGPGSQQKENPHEADSCFGTVIEGFDDVVVGRIHKMPGKEFINDPKKHVLIKKLAILVPSGSDGDYVEWRPL